MSNGELILYTTEDGKTSIQAKASLPEVLSEESKK